MSAFSDFIRNATPEEKAIVYEEVMRKASERQNAAPQVSGSAQQRPETDTPADAALYRTT